MLRSLIVSTIFLLAVIPAAHAQEEPVDDQIMNATPEDRSLIEPNEYNFISGPYYNQLAQTLFKNKPAVFDYSGLRMQYALTRQYDPVGENTQRQMLAFAYKAQTEKDPAKAAEALTQYTDLVIAHLANMKIVLQAQALARQDKRFGDARFFEQVHAGLLRSVLNSGDGKTLNDAYDVITPEEEVALLAALRIKVIQTKYSHAGIVYYNMHDYIDEEEKAAHTIFVNVSSPMKYLESQHRDKGQVYQIPKR